MGQPIGQLRNQWHSPLFLPTAPEQGLNQCPSSASLCPSQAEHINEVCWAKDPVIHPDSVVKIKKKSKNPALRCFAQTGHLGPRTCLLKPTRGKGGGCFLEANGTEVGQAKEGWGECLLTRPSTFTPLSASASWYRQDLCRADQHRYLLENVLSWCSLLNAGAASIITQSKLLPVPLISQHLI